MAIATADASLRCDFSLNNFIFILFIKRAEKAVFKVYPNAHFIYFSKLFIFKFKIKIKEKFNKKLVQLTERTDQVSKQILIEMMNKLI